MEYKPDYTKIVISKFDKIESIEKMVISTTKKYSNTDSNGKKSTQ